MSEVIENKNITARDIDKIVCDWTFETGAAISQEQLDSLVDRICGLMAIDTKEGMT